MVELILFGGARHLSCNWYTKAKPYLGRQFSDCLISGESGGAGQGRERDVVESSGGLQPLILQQAGGHLYERENGMHGLRNMDKGNKPFILLSN